MRFQRPLFAAIGSLVIGSAGLGVAGPVRADSVGCHLALPHCYSVIVSTGSLGMYGMYGTWNRGYMYTPADTDNRRFITAEMWAGPEDVDAWVETGHTVGWFSPEGGTGHYYVFMAWMTAGGAYAERSFGTVPQNASVTDEFQIQRISTPGTWRVYFNGTSKTSPDVGFGLAPRLDYGGEVASALGTTSIFTMYAQGVTSGGVKTNLGTETPQIEWDPPMYGSRPGESAWNWRIRP